MTLQQLRGYPITRLARYELPNLLHVVAKMLRDPTGKALRYQRRDDLAGR